MCMISLHKRSKLVDHMVAGCKITAGNSDPGLQDHNGLPGMLLATDH